MTINGVDVSSYQSATFATAGLAFAFVKSTEGTNYVNPKHDAQVAHSRAAGLVVGHYHFGRSNSGATEADYFLAHTNIQPGDILAFDWENPAVSQTARDNFIRRVQQRAVGHKVVEYCNVDYWTHRDTESFCGDGLWIADPNHPAGHPAISHAWAFHQYSWAGGIDRNVGNFANAAALRAWATPAQPKPVVVTKPVAAPAPAVTVASLNTRVNALEADVKVLQSKVH